MLTLFIDVNTLLKLMIVGIANKMLKIDEINLRKIEKNERYMSVMSDCKYLIINYYILFLGK